MVACENCGEVMHRVLKGKMSGHKELVFQGVVKCQKCGVVRDIIFRERKPLKIQAVVSWMDKSEKVEVEMEEDALVRVGEIIEIDSGKVEVTAIESVGRRVPACRAHKVNTLWAKRVDKVRVKVTLAKGSRAVSRDIFVSPEKEFCVGAQLEIGKDKAIIEHIKTGQRTLYKDCAEASEIKRLYARVAGIRRNYRPFRLNR